MNINFELYKVFYQIAKEGKISAASKKLFVTQPAVSQSIKQLEERLGGKLFFRTPKGMKLTVEGKMLFSYIEKAYDLIKTGEMKFEEMNTLEYGEINIGASDTLCSHYLLPYLEEFHKKFPKIKIKITNRTTYEIINLLKNGSVDLGVLNMPVEDDNQLNITESLTIEDCFIYGKKYSSFFKDKVSLKKLNRFPIILLEKGSSTRNFIDNIFIDKKLKLEPEIELGSNDLLVKFAKIGLGISFVSKSSIKNELNDGDIFEVKLKEKIPKRKIGIATLKGVFLSPAGQEFLAFLQGV
ncbi:MAG: LysR family transcriptional regulator [Candidatus Delongbacteria bacterium]|jgi:LysR family cyn operon transcriptional activator|nr:LysR family transcriptional regulator [Candidatus Delongbacteria bacterium]